MYKTDLNDSKSNNNETAADQKNDENKFGSSTVCITKPLYNELKDQCFKNSVVRLEEHKELYKPIRTIRKTFCSASIFNHNAVTNKKLFSNKDDQKYKDPTIDNSCQSRCEKPIDSYDIPGSNIISDTIVKLTEHGNECNLFESSKRSELENKLNDPSLFYTNIPKTILGNLSQFFDKHRTGVDLHKMMKLFRSKYGRSYEPLNYGYSSEKHMFESLDKMVEIKNSVLYTKDPFAYTKLLKTINPIDMNENTALLLPGNDFLLNYSSSDICNGRFKYSTIKFNDLKLIKVIVADVYNPNSFYIQLAKEVDILNKFMDELQEFYNENEEKYKVSAKLILPELPCTSYIKGTNFWHRAKVLKIVDEENVQLFFVDYGTIEIIPKRNIRLLQSRFSAYATQAIHCGLYKCREYNYSREISEYFADMVEHHVLEAQVHPPIPKDDCEKIMVTLFLNTKYDQINLNKRIFKVLANVRNESHSSTFQNPYKR
ncbi:uncharacterized protein LOC132935429 isoform X2 [Metopolophium dirhodum]|nr:uncharacterized protein LOC132935429 isoform X2 [Metopolophium dirhodum]XP_060857956.1 uncharacterized protein LOC132935429 isoform X2 [Metopolophium dirhodum]XP_060857957.1 uncharacterized protein LOC132935429 isoform X2 [Metopolophium dirhodum]